MSKTVEEMYQEMLNDGSLGDFPGLGLGFGRGSSADDVEEFVTSKEIVKEQKLLEEQFGANRPGSKPRGGAQIIEEEVHFKRYTTRREHKYTESEKAAIRESCEATIVHDYGERDIYHLSDDERAKMDQLHEIRGKLSRMKRIYYKVDQYVEAMRTVMEAWNILERNNVIHTKDEFYALVAEGRIYSNSIIMPKLKKMDNYNIDMLIKYISNPEADARDLIPAGQEQQTDSFYDDFMLTDDPEYQRYYDEYVDSQTDEEIEEKGSMKINQEAHEYAVGKLDEDRMRRLLSPEEVQFIIDNADNPPKIEVKTIKRRFIKGYDRREFGKKKSKGSKQERYIRENLHDLLNKIQSNSAFNQGAQFNRSYLVTSSMFDTDKPERSLWDALPFNGSWANEADVLLYDLAVREELLKQHPANQRYLTYADQELDRFFSILEKNGVSTLELRRQMNIINDGLGGDSRTTAAKKKENKKLEAAVLQRLTKLNQSPKFKKLAAKAERDLNNRFEEG